jgi:hypothetical protein
MGCCNKIKEDDREYPENVQPCCGGVRGRRCLCLPYDDPFMITSQILTIIAVFFSWVWWVSFIISIVGLVLYQVPWCCRQNGGPLYASAAAAGVTALCHLGAGIYVLVAFRYPKKSSCSPFDFYSYKSDYHNNDYCREEVWGTIAFVCTALWAAAFGCLVHFVRSGRHYKWEKQHSPDCDDNNGEVELEAAGAAVVSAGPVIADAAVVVPEPVGKV